ncbi:carbohydrate ABC transporter permease [Gracilibacillus alcaliphilus]|uniref:carbohydrate ABC transporter permease n=1 Tax=Gracilibacillus alcaliphilus TaxID=1401441 RepID=UPI00195E7EA5|nr:sugar ABC transporter permease [Gracilibacillus alcaliphilus]MBM7675680.1 multiple sugar transport system permease protein [Gracilibacillus alcaliphilus]
MHDAKAIPFTRRKRWSKATLTPWIFLSPALLIIMIFVILPTIAGVVISFLRYDAISPVEFIGLQNYKLVFQDQLFYKSMWITFLFAFGSLLPTVFISLVLAVLLNQKWFPFVNLFRAVYFLPTVVSMVAVSFVWLWLFNPQLGPINPLLSAFGISAQQFLGDSSQALAILILINIWKSIGFNLVIYLAGLQGIDNSLYEAARIDGASPLQSFRFITWPMLTPVTFFVVAMLIINGFQVFDQINIMTGGGPARSTYAIVFYIYQKGFSETNFGYASVLAVMLFIVILVLTLAYHRINARLER